MASDHMTLQERKNLAGRARGAAETLVATWTALGSWYEDYDTVWNGKEYLLAAADKLEELRLDERDNA